MNITSTESTIRTVEEVAPFPVVIPSGSGRDSGQRWQVERFVTDRTVEFDGFGRWVTVDEPTFSAYGRKLNQDGRAYGAQHLLWWLTNREMVEQIVARDAERLAALLSELDK